MALAILAAGVLAAGADAPATTPPAATPQPTPAAAPAPGATALQPGMRAFIEPETGKLGPPTAVPALAPEDGATKPANAPVLVHMPDGSDMLELNGSIEDYVIIKLDANGNKIVDCVEDPTAAIQAPAPAPQREDR